MKILCQYGVPAEGFAPLREHELIMPPLLQTMPEEELFRQLPDTQVIISNKPLTGEMMKAAPKLKLICAYGAGYDHIDRKAATERGILICNVPESVTGATAELAIALLLSLTRQILGMDRGLRAGHANEMFRMGLNMGRSLDGMLLGLIGYGRIGQRVADLGRCFGMKIAYCCPHRKPEREALGDRYLPLEELLRQSDAVSIHCPLNSDTYHLLDVEKIALMKPTAYLINTARGAIVEDEALIRALREGHIAGAGLDVFTEEPKVHPDYLTLDNVVLTPHIGSNTAQTRYRMAQAISKAILDFAAGKLPEHVVNPEVLRHC